MKSIAIFYATREGHTRKIAERIAVDLTNLGFLADVKDTRDPHTMIDLGMYSSAILAASVHMGSHEKEMVRFVKHYRADLERIPTVFLSVTLSEAGVERPGQSPEARARSEAGVKQVIDKFIHDTGWHPTHIKAVAGALPYTKYNPIVRFVMKHIAQSEGADTDTTKEYEYTDWVSLDHFVEEFARETANQVTAK
jgi:menaquinone-dependent protoporphyrinogen oxidase